MFIGDADDDISTLEDAGGSDAGAMISRYFGHIADDIATVISRYFLRSVAISGFDFTRRPPSASGSLSSPPL